MNTVSQVAFKDIQDWINFNGLTIMDGNKDVWVVTPSRLVNKSQRKLNRDLGVSKLNYNGIRK